jgi:hypothetical protein
MLSSILVNVDKMLLLSFGAAIAFDACDDVFARLRADHLAGVTSATRGRSGAPGTTGRRRRI